MLKYYTILISLLFSDLYADSIDDKDQHLQEAVRFFIEKRCLANGGEGAFKNLEYSIDDFRSCINHEIVTFGADDEDDPLQKICSGGSARDSLHFCMVLVLDQLEPCLDKQEYYLPSFISGWFNSTFEEHCKDGGETIKEQIKAVLQGLDCKAMDKKLTHEVAEKCFLQSTLIKDFESSDFIITKTRLCEYFQRGNKCLLEFIKEICDPKISTFIEYHLRPTKLWCDKYVHDLELD